EVVAAAEVDVAERLEVRDRTRPHAGLLRRGEAEEELRRVGDQICARDLRRLGKLFRERALAVEAAAGEAAPDRRHREQLRPAEPRDGIVDVPALVRAEEDRDVVPFEARVGWVARKAL